MYYSVFGACRFAQFSLNECLFLQNSPSMSDFYHFYLHIWEICCIFAAFLNKGVHYTLFGT